MAGACHDTRFLAGEIGGHPGDLIATGMTLDGHETVHGVLHRTVSRVHVGIDWTGLDGVDGYSTLSEVTGQSANHALHRGFGQRIGRTAGKWHPIGIARADDDHATAPVHLTRRFDEGVIRCAHVDIDHRINRIGLQFEWIAHDEDAGIGDDDVQFAALCDCFHDRRAIGAVRPYCNGSCFWLSQLTELEALYATFTLYQGHGPVPIAIAEVTEQQRFLVALRDLVAERTTDEVLSANERDEIVLALEAKWPFYAGVAGNTRREILAFNAGLVAEQMRAMVEE